MFVQLMEGNPRENKAELRWQTLYYGVTSLLILPQMVE